MAFKCASTQLTAHKLTYGEVDEMYSNGIPLPRACGHGSYARASCHLTLFPYRKKEGERQQALNLNITEL